MKLLTHTHTAWIFKLKLLSSETYIVTATVHIPLSKTVEKTVCQEPKQIVLAFLYFTISIHKDVFLNAQIQYTTTKLQFLEKLNNMYNISILITVY